MIIQKRSFFESSHIFFSLYLVYSATFGFVVDPLTIIIVLSLILSIAVFHSFSKFAHIYLLADH